MYNKLLTENYLKALMKEFSKKKLTLDELFPPECGQDSKHGLKGTKIIIPLELTIKLKIYKDCSLANRLKEECAKNRKLFYKALEDVFPKPSCAKKVKGKKMAGDMMGDGSGKIQLAPSMVVESGWVGKPSPLQVTAAKVYPKYPKELLPSSFFKTFINYVYQKKDKRLLYLGKKTDAVLKSCNISKTRLKKGFTFIVNKGIDVKIYKCIEKLFENKPPAPPAAAPPRTAAEILRADKDLAALVEAKKKTELLKSFIKSRVFGLLLLENQDLIEVI